MSIGTHSLDIRHLASVTHDGKLVVFATDAAGVVRYSVKRDGYEDGALRQGNELFGFEEWRELPLDRALEDPSVERHEREELVDTQGHPLLRSRYGAAPELIRGAVAPVRAVSALGHIHLFRQDPNGRLLVQRFVLDGMQNLLIPKLEVRFRRSRQRLEPEGRIEKSAGGMRNADSLDYRDMDDQPFYEPACELSFLPPAVDGWFDVLLLPTAESGRWRWHVFIARRDTQELELYSVRSSLEGRFDLNDYLFQEKSPTGDESFRSIPGITRRRIAIEGRVLAAGPAATAYDLQYERQTNVGMQLIREASRVMLCVPVREPQGSAVQTAALSFAVGRDGLLSRIDLTPDASSEVLKSTVRDLLLPLNALDGIREVAQLDPPPSGAIDRMDRGEMDRLRIRSRAPLGGEVRPGHTVKLRGTKSYDGFYTVTLADPETFTVDAEFTNNEVGFWEVVPRLDTGLVFDNMLVGCERTPDGRLRVITPGHDLRPGDRVQLTGTVARNGLYPVKSVDEEGQSFELDYLFHTGEALNLTTFRRRGLRFEHTPAASGAGAPPTACRFDGQGHLHAPGGLRGIRNAITVEFWAKGTNTKLRTVFQADGASRIHLPWTSEVVWDCGGQRLKKAASPAEHSGGWHHWAFVRDARGVSQIYLDGRPWASKRSRPASPGASTAVFIGCDKSRVQQWVGSLSELRVWSVARSAAEVRASLGQRMSGNEPGLAHCWPLDAASVSATGATVRAQDIAGGLHAEVHGLNVEPEADLPLVAPVSAPAPAAEPQRLETEPLELDLPQPDRPFGRTVSTWVKRETGGGERVLVRDRGGLLCLRLDADGHALLELRFSDGRTRRVRDPNPLPLDTWVHVAGIVDYDRSAGGVTRLSLLRDGRQASGAPPRPRLAPTGLRFDGVRNHVQLGPIDAAFAGGFTFEAWVRWDSLRDRARVLDLGNSTRSWHQDSIIICGRRRTTHLDVSVINGRGPIRTLTANGFLETGRWIHLALVITPARTATVYKDGVAVASGPLPLPNSVRRTNGLLSLSSRSRAHSMHGAQAEVRLWTVPRSAQQIQESRFHALRGDEPGLAGYWPLANGEAADLSGNGATGTLVGPAREPFQPALPAPLAAPPATETVVLFDTPVHLGRELFLLDGVDDGFDTAAHDTPTDALTVSFWARSAGPTWNAGEALISKAGAFRCSGDAGLRSAIFQLHAGGWQAAVRFEPADISRWHHYAATYDGARLRAYLDGALVDERTLALSIDSSPQPIRIGHDGAGAFLAGQIADLRVYGVALPEDALRAGMFRDERPTLPGLVGYWPLRDGLSRDLASHKRHATPRGTPDGVPAARCHPQARVDEAPRFQGAEWVELPAVTLDTSRGFSCELWAHLEPPALGSTAPRTLLRLVSRPGHDELTLRQEGAAVAAELVVNGTAHSLRAGQVFAAEEWVHLTLSCEPNGTTSLYRDGALVAGDLLALPTSGTWSQNALAGSSPGITPAGRFLGALAEVRIWTRALTPKLIAERMANSLAGDEPDLAGCWPLAGGRLEDVSPGGRPAALRGTPGGTPFVALDRGLHRIQRVGEGFQGELSELRVWNEARRPQEVERSMFLQLSGREPGLAGYWRLGAILWEQPPYAPDFSVHGRKAFVHGEVYAGARTLRRATSSGRRVVRYANDDLFAVAQRARYEESFEFRVRWSPGTPPADFDVHNADGTGRRLFRFDGRGKNSRGAGAWNSFPLSHVDEEDFATLEGGWYRARTRFTVPDGVNLMRVFGLKAVAGRWSSQATAPAGEWSAIDVRKHRVRLLSQSVTRQDYSDGVQLGVLAAAGGSGEAELAQIRAAEAEVAEAVAEIREVDERARLAAKLPLYTTELAAIETRLTQLLDRDWTLRSEMHAIRTSPLHTWFRLINVAHRRALVAAPSASTTRDFTEGSRLPANQLWTVERRTGGGVHYCPRAKSGQFLGCKYGERAKVGGAQRWQMTHRGGRRYSFRRSCETTKKVRPIQGLNVTVDVPTTVDAALRCGSGGFLSSSNPRLSAYNTTYTSQQWDADFVELTDAGRARMETLEAEMAEVAAELARKARRRRQLQGWLGSVMGGGSLSRDAAGTRLADADARLAQLNTAYLAGLTRAAPAAMPVVQEDLRGLVTTGALLDFVRPRGALHSTATCEGDVLLSCVDPAGRMQLTRYDAVADSRNATFEQWVPARGQAALELRDRDDAIQLARPIPLQADAWTFEALAYFPAAAQTGAQAGAPYPYNFLGCAEEHLDAPIALRFGSALGTVVDGCFYDTGVDVGELTPGWYHLAAVGEGGRTRLYLDGLALPQVGPPADAPAGAIRFDSSGDSIQRDAVQELSGSGFTLRFWVQVPRDTPNPERGTLLSYKVGADDDALALRDPTDLCVVHAGLANEFRSGVALNDGFWHHVALSWDEASGRLRLYVDDESHELPDAPQTLPGGGTLALGAGQGTEGAPLGGSLRSFSIWERELDYGELSEQRDQTPQGDEEDLLLHWSLAPSTAEIEEGVLGEQVADATANKAAGAVTGTPLPVALPAQCRRDLTVIGNAGGGGYPAGRLADVRLWGEALSPAEIAVNARSALSGNEPGLLGHWPLAAGSDNLARDLSEDPVHGTIAGAAWVACTARVGDTEHTELPASVRLGAGSAEQVVRLVHAESSLTFPLDFDFDDPRGWRIAFHVKLRPGYEGSLIRANDGSWDVRVGTFRGFLGLSSSGVRIFRNGQRLATTGLKTAQRSELEGRWLRMFVSYEPAGPTRPTSGTLTAVVGHSPDTSICWVSVAHAQPSYDGFVLPARASYAELSLSSSDDTAALDLLRQRYSQGDRHAGTEAGLVAYWPLTEIQGDRVLDRVGESHGRARAAEIGLAPWLQLTPAPEEGLTQAALRPAAQLIAGEYSSTSLDAEGRTQAIMRRFFAYAVHGRARLLPEKRVEKLELRWVGNQQLQPTLLGYIEGAPPVPSENLTINPDYDRATSVRLSQTQEVRYAWRASDTNEVGVDIDTFIGAAWSISAGLGIQNTLSEGRAGVQAKASLKTTNTQNSAVTAGSSLSMTDSLTLSGRAEQTPRFAHLGRRYLPKNVGYALVVSGLADVFISRLARTGRMVGYEVRPVDGVPLDVNTITFLINPAYVMNGSLDGQVGSRPADPTFYPHVPAMRSQYGSLYPASYLRLREAYELKERIERQDKAREAFFANLQPGKAFRDVQRGRDPGGESELALGEISQDSSDEENEERRAAIEARSGSAGSRVRASAAFARWQQRMERVLQRTGKRNIVNTYVWDADGGLRSEEQGIANVIEHSLGTAQSTWGGGGARADFMVPAMAFEVNLLVTGGRDTSSEKTVTQEEGLELSVDMSGLESNGITDLQDRPLLPGEKVDRYRFMSFFLEGDIDHFHEFFTRVVDPEWLASNDEEARALRMAQAGKANRCWRVLHRVTYVERPALLGRNAASAGADDATDAILNYFDVLEDYQRDVQSRLDELLRLTRGGA